MKYADKQERVFDDEKLKAGQCVIGLQVRTVSLRDVMRVYESNLSRQQIDSKAQIEMFSSKTDLTTI